MRPYSLDLRERAVAAVTGGPPLLTTARLFGLGKSTLQRSVQAAATGHLAACQRRL